MPEKIKPIYIDHPNLPSDITLAVIGLVSKSSNEVTRQKSREIQKQLGRQLISDVIAHQYGPGQCNIFSEKNGKPHAILDDSHLQISIAHCSGMITGAVSDNRVLGLDIEHSSRKCYSGLRNRILNKNEVKLVREISTLQLWTVKEAALKWSGSGLRTPMNQLSVRKIESSQFIIEFPTGIRIDICSFLYENFWLSIAYGSRLNNNTSINDYND